MALFEQFPYTNFHEMNLDWILRVGEQAQETLTGYEEDMAQIAADTQTAANAAAAAAADAATVNTKVGQATTAANNAAASATSASGSATIATNKANAAAASANAAAGSASDAHSDALAAAGSASDAHDDALAAAASASDAHDDALAAAGSASDAATDAADAANSASVAGTNARVAISNIVEVEITDTLTVLAQRTYTGGSLNLAGLITFTLPYPQTKDAEPGDTYSTDGVQFDIKRADLIAATLISPGAGQYGVTLFPVKLPDAAYKTVDGKQYKVFGVRAFDASAGSFLANDATISGIRAYFAKAKYSTAGAAVNTASLSD